MVSKPLEPNAGPAPSPHPFDAAAAGYDESFTETRLGRWYRRMVWDRLQTVFGEDDHVLELGCGTGEDAIFLARRGIRVHATDASEVMLRTARSKARASDVEKLVSFQSLDLNDAADLSAAGVPNDGSGYDGLLASFGPLNCVEDRRTLARRLARIVRPGGRLVVSAMGPICPWEIAWHLARFEFGTAFRRLRSGKQAHVGGGGTLPVWYPSLRRLESEFSTEFHTIDRLGLGLLMPPSGMARLVERFPRLFRVPAVIDRRGARLRPWLWFNDHYLLVMERRDR